MTGAIHKLYLTKRMDDYARLYPQLFQESTWPWGPARIRFVILDEAPPENQVANVNIVPFDNHGWIMIRLVDGMWDIPVAPSRMMKHL
jgi:hypothetical protein